MPKKLSASLLILSLCLLGMSLQAQSNAVMDELIAQKPVQFGHAAYFVLSATGQIPETATIEQAASFALGQNWGLPKLDAASPLPLDQLALIIMKGMGLKGGVLYTMFPNSRYALRELTFLKVAAAPVWPEKLVAGDEALRMITKALDIKEGK